MLNAGQQLSNVNLTGMRVTDLIVHYFWIFTLEVRDETQPHMITLLKSWTTKYGQNYAIKK
jgi:hypothetical protein